MSLAEQNIISSIDVSSNSTLDLDLDERRDSLVGKIAADIARAIADGDLLPGADLNSVELAARFGTSRTPVREALMLLEKEGLVEIPPRRRPRVAHISMDEVQEIYEIRAVLNGLMIRGFIAGATAGDIDYLQQLVADAHRSAKSGDPDAAFDFLNAIHVRCLERCGNTSLIRLLGSWKMRMSVRRIVVGRSAQLERALIDHERLVIACAEREAALASQLIESMTRFGMTAIQQHQQGLAERQ